MQFSVVSIIAVLAATVSAQYGNGTTYPTGTAAPSVSYTATGIPPPFTGAAVQNAGSAFALLAAGGVAMML